MPLKVFGGVIARIDTFETEGSPGLTATHKYPFKTFPIIKSHLHPKFAIVNAGEKLLKLGDTDGPKIFLDFPGLQAVIHIYVAWTRPANLSDKSFNVPR